MSLKVLKKPILIFLLLAVSYYFYFKYNSSTNKEHLTPMPESAAEACKQISSKAEEIEAHYKGLDDLATNFMAFANPKNYKSGDNTSNDMMRNIINVNMSNNDITEMQNSCKNISSTMQLNEIDLTQCDYCQKNGCSVANVTQENISKSNQICGIQAAIDILRKKENSIESQALAETLQKAQGLMSGDNTSRKQNCNIVNQDMSSNQYFKTINDCANTFSGKQENRIKGCGPVLNVIQKNDNDNFQKCVMGATVSSKDEYTSKIKATSEAKSKQESEGLEIAASLGILCFCCISLLLSAAAAFLMSQQQGNGQTPKFGLDNVGFSS